MTTQQPVVVTINGDSDTQRSVGNGNKFTKYIFGVQPRLINVELELWAIDPNDGDLARIVQDDHDLSMNEAKAWIDSKQYGSDVLRKVLMALAELKVDTGAVRAIVLPRDCANQTVLDAFNDVFKGAAVCNVRGEIVSRFSSMLLSDIGLDKELCDKLTTYSIKNVGRLIERSGAEILDVTLIDEEELGQINAALATEGLELRQE